MSDMKRLVLMAAMIASPASAGDLPLWSRFYGGINAGYGFGTDQSVRNDGVASPGIWSQDYMTGLANTSPYNSGGNIASSGVVAGGQVGWNYQVNSMFVAGVEADMQGSGIAGSGNVAGMGALGLSNGVGGWVVNTRVNTGVSWIGTARGRLGYLVSPSVLVYGTGGLAYGQTKLDAVPQTGFFVLPLAQGYPTMWSQSTASSFVAGWTVGGGAEWMVAPNWSVKGEALYYDLGGQSVNNQEYLIDQVMGNMTTRVSYQGVVARAGVNYHFDLFR